MKIGDSKSGWKKLIYSFYIRKTHLHSDCRRQSRPHEIDNLIEDEKCRILESQKDLYSIKYICINHE